MTKQEKCYYPFTKETSYHLHSLNYVYYEFTRKHAFLYFEER